MRTINEIQKDYSDVCAQLGHLKFQSVALENKLKELIDKLSDLNKEAAAVAAASEPKKEEANV